MNIFYTLRWFFGTKSYQLSEFYKKAGSLDKTGEYGFPDYRSKPVEDLVELKNSADAAFTEMGMKLEKIGENAGNAGHGFGEMVGLGTWIGFFLSLPPEPLKNFITDIFPQIYTLPEAFVDAASKGIEALVPAGIAYFLAYSIGKNIYEGREKSRMSSDFKNLDQAWKGVCIALSEKDVKMSTDELNKHMVPEQKLSLHQMGFRYGDERVKLWKGRTEKGLVEKFLPGGDMSTLYSRNRNLVREFKEDLENPEMSIEAIMKKYHLE